MSTCQRSQLIGWERGSVTATCACVREFRSFDSSRRRKVTISRPRKKSRQKNTLLLLSSQIQERRGWGFVNCVALNHIFAVLSQCQELLNIINLMEYSVQCL